MPRRIGEALVGIEPDTKGFSAKATPDMGRAGAQGGSAFVGRFQKVMAVGVAGALAAAFAAKAVVGFVGGALGEAREAVRVGKLTDAVIRSTGGAAKVTAAHVGTLADKISVLAGVDDEAVQGAENLLLTFTRIRNTRTDKIFDQATQAIVDMTAAMNKGIVTEEGLHSATIQVGKALNDPIKGVTALSKVGVTFTQKQKDQIKALVESGQVMKAQKIILSELKTEFGGAAAAAADPAQKASVAWANFKETLGGLFLPTFNKVMDLLTGKAIPVLEGRVVPTLQRMGTVFAREVMPRIREFAGWFGREVVPRAAQVHAILLKLVPTIQDLGRRLREDGSKALQSVRNAIAENRPQLEALWRGFKQVVDFIVTKVVPILGPSLTTSLRGTGAMISFAINSIAGLVEAFKFIIAEVKAVIGVTKVMAGAWNASWAFVVNLVRSAINFIVTGFNTGMSRLLTGVRRLTALAAFFRNVFAQAKNAVVGKVGELVGFARSIPGRILSALGNVGGMLYGAGQRIIQGLINGISSMIGRLLDKIRDAVQRIKDYLPFSPAKRGPFSGRGNPFYSGQSIPRMLAAGIRSQTDSVTRAAEHMVGSARNRSYGADGVSADDLARAFTRALGRAGITVRVGRTAIGELIGRDVDLIGRAG